MAAMSATDFADAVWAKVLGGSKTAENTISIIAAATGGKVRGAETSTVIFRDVDDSKDIITANVDANGNRTSITYGV